MGHCIATRKEKIPSKSYGKWAIVTCKKVFTGMSVSGHMLSLLYHTDINLYGI